MSIALPAAGQNRPGSGTRMLSRNAAIARWPPSNCGHWLAGNPLMSQLWQDLRYAVRTLLKSPGFLLVAVLSLALGIGANSAIFAVINAVMLRTLPVANPERLALLTDPGSSGTSVETTEHGERRLLSYPEFDQLRARNSVFQGMFAAMSAPATLDVA